MRRRGQVAALCVLVVVVVSAVLYLYPLASSTDVSVSGSSSSAKGEMISFQVDAAHQYDAGWVFLSNWEVGGVARSSTTYSYVVSLTGQNVVDGSVHLTVQFKAVAGATESVRWTSDVLGLSIPLVSQQYQQGETIDAIAGALGFSGVSNNTSTTVAFKVFVDVWATGSSGSSLHVASDFWKTFDSNEIVYKKVQIASVIGTYYPASVAFVDGATYSGSLGNVAADDSVYWTVRGQTTSVEALFDLTFTGMPTPSGAISYAYLEYEDYPYDQDMGYVETLVWSYTASSFGTLKLDSSWHYLGGHYYSSWWFSYVAERVDGSGNLKIRFHLGGIYSNYHCSFDYLRVVVWTNGASWFGLPELALGFLGVLGAVAVVAVVVLHRRRAC